MADQDKNEKAGAPTVKSLFQAVEKRHECLFDEGTGNQKEHLNVVTTAGAAKEDASSNIGSADTLNRLKTVEAKGGASAASARKTQNLLMKTKASGDNGIAAADRIFLVLTFTKELETRKCFYVNKRTCTVGDLVEKVAKQFPFPAFKKAMRPDGMSLDIRIVSVSTSTSRLGITPYGLDRKALVGEVMEDMEEIEFTQASSEELAAKSTQVSTYLEEKTKEDEKAAKAKAAAKNIPGSGKETVDPTRVATGDIYMYTKDGADELVTVENIHRDDYPNLYFTIRFMKMGHEKQTTSNFLNAIKPEESTDGGGFSITLAHGMRNYTIGGLSESITVAAFKVLVQNVSNVAPKNQSLICRGSMLKNDLITLAETKIRKGCKVSLIGAKKK